MNNFQNYERNARRAVVIFIMILLTLIPLFLLPGNVEAEIDGEFGYLPTHPWYRRESCGTDCFFFVHPDGWKVKAICLEPDMKIPEWDKEHYRDGDKLIPMEGGNIYQPFKITHVVEEPTPTPVPTPTATPEPQIYRYYIPTILREYKFYECDCSFHTCDILINTSVWRTLYLLEYPLMGTVTGILNLDATQHDALNVRCYFKRGSVHGDPGYSHTILIVDCKGKDAYTVVCPNGICPPIGCGGLNGTAPCVGTAATYTCDKICRGKFSMTDTP
jgi:hypothetical protein